MVGTTTTKGMKKMVDVEQLPDGTLTYIGKLRQEAARFRTQRNAKQRDLEVADARIVELEAEVKQLRSVAMLFGIPLPDSTPNACPR